MDALLTAIAMWLSINYGLPASFEHPRIEHVASVEMATLRRRGLLLSRQREASVMPERDPAAGDERAILAIYDDHTRTIYLPLGWSGTSPAELSVLVHEMVHHLQTKGGMTFECPAAREKLAYEAQEKWLGLFGRSLESEFGVDKFTLFVSTSCAMASGLH
jgi:hypothetical protein